MNQQHFYDFYNLIFIILITFSFFIDILNSRDIMLLWQFKMYKYKLHVILLYSLIYLWILYIIFIIFFSYSGHDVSL